ncbi:hypothetical protein RchiOBHm_Chr2g0171271 [Rosa chinensis]|uniref:Uncharacterized protein n=1 Tax=Rosa chinensis TaxID=74649 RepID=A0A2P6S5D6_ROSCH|nr:hypothetical protein RchiOBHm_Chr2g0171271 [Rosa chinensis]
MTILALMVVVLLPIRSGFFFFLPLQNPDAPTADTGASKKDHISGIPTLVQEQWKEKEVAEKVVSKREELKKREFKEGELQVIDGMAKNPDAPTTYTGARKEDYISGIPKQAKRSSSRRRGRSWKGSPSSPARTPHLVYN